MRVICHYENMFSNSALFIFQCVSLSMLFNFFTFHPVYWVWIKNFKPMISQLWFIYHTLTPLNVNVLFLAGHLLPTSARRELPFVQQPSVPPQPSGRSRRIRQRSRSGRERRSVGNEKEKRKKLLDYQKRSCKYLLELEQNNFVLCKNDKNVENAI